MNDRSTARLAGVLVIAADLVGVPALLLHKPVADGGAVAPDATGIVTGALLGLLMGLTVAAIAVVIHPVLRRVGERLALGYVAICLLEGALDVLGALCWLTLVAVSQSVDAIGATAANGTTDGGTALLPLLDRLSYVLKPIVFGLGALVLNATLYRTRLVPRWLSGWGVVGAALWVAAGVLVAYGAGRCIPMSLPIGLQELAFAGWLIVKGFDPRTLSSEVEAPSAGVDRPARPAAVGAA